MKEMTEEQLEAAARLLCEKRGIYPDEDSKIEFELDGETYVQICPSWANAREEIVAHYEVLLCIAEVMDKGD